MWPSCKFRGAAGWGLAHEGVILRTVLPRQPLSDWLGDCGTAFRTDAVGARSQVVVAHRAEDRAGEVGPEVGERQEGCSRTWLFGGGARCRQRSMVVSHRSLPWECYCGRKSRDKGFCHRGQI